MRHSGSAGSCCCFRPSVPFRAARKCVLWPNVLLRKAAVACCPIGPALAIARGGRLGYGAAALQHFLADFAAAVVPRGAAVVAAEHATSYALMLARDRPGVWSHAVLLAPTWRGRSRPRWVSRGLTHGVRGLVGTPVVGEALYRLNTLRCVIGLMYRRHVYSEAGRITPAFIAKKAGRGTPPGSTLRVSGVCHRQS
jgi:hypothetical protein